MSGIRIHDPSVRASEDNSCLRPRGYCASITSYILVYAQYKQVQTGIKLQDYWSNRHLGHAIM
jgi:hypothetical protein